MNSWLVKLISLTFWLLIQGALAVDLIQLRPLETLRLQSTGGVTQIVFSPNQQSLAVVTTNSKGYLGQEIDFWKISTGRRLWRWALPTTDQTISNLRFLDANVIELRLSTNLFVQLSTRTGKQYGQAKPEAPTIEARLLHYLNFTPASLAANPLVTASSSLGISAYSQQTSGITLVDTKSLREIGLLEETDGQVMRLEFSPNGQQLAAARADGRISLWDVTKRKKRLNLRGHQSWNFSALEWSSDAKQLLSIVSAEGAMVWNTQTGAPITTISNRLKGIEVATLSASGRSIAIQQRGAMFILRIGNGTVTHHIGFEVSKTAFSNDGQMLCVAAGDGRIRVYQRGLNGYQLRDELRENGYIAAMTVISGQRLVFQVVSFAKNQSSIGIYQLKTREVKKLLLSDEHGTVEYIIGTKNPNEIFLGKFLFDIKTGEYGGLIENSEVLDYFLRPDIDRIIFYYEETLIMKVFSSNATVWKRSWFNGRGGFAWSPSGALLASGWPERRVIIADAKTGKTKALINQPLARQPDQPAVLQSLVFSPSETMLLATYSNPSQRTLRIFDLSTRAEMPIPSELRIMKPSTSYRPEFTPDGRRLMISTLEGLEFWGMSSKNVFGK